jgi:hypothetical protein
MARFRGRLREWWRGAYMIRGFGFLIPGFERQQLRDYYDFYDRLQHYVVRIYPDNWWVAVYRSVPIVGESPEELRARLRILMERDGVPKEFEPAMLRVGTGNG